MSERGKVHSRTHTPLIASKPRSFSPVSVAPLANLHLLTISRMMSTPASTHTKYEYENACEDTQ